MTVTNKVANSVAAHQSPSDCLKWYYSIRSIIGVVWLQLVFKSHTILFYFIGYFRVKFGFSDTFHCFLFYFRFAEVSNHTFPNNNTNATPYHIYNLVCTGIEDSVEDCSFSWALRNCSDKSAINVSCSKCANLNADHIIFCFIF